MHIFQTLFIFLILFIVAMLLCWLATGSPPFVKQRRRTEEITTLPKKASSDVRVIKTKKAIIIEFLEKKEEVKQVSSHLRVPAEKKLTKIDSCDSLSTASESLKDNDEAEAS